MPIKLKILFQLVYEGFSLAIKGLIVELFAHTVGIVVRRVICVGKICWHGFLIYIVYYYEDYIVQR